MDISRNYTEIMKREKRVYSFSGTKISDTGISYSFLRVFGFFLMVYTILGVLTCLIFNKNFYNPIGKDFSIIFYFIFFGGPLLTAFAFHGIRIQQYRLYEYILAIIKPKRTYDSNGEVIVIKNYEINTIVERAI